MTAPVRDSMFFRVSRLARLFTRSMAASRGMDGKLAMCRCLSDWFTTRLGRHKVSREVTLRLGDLTMTVDTTRAEIGPYWELWFEDSYEALPQFKAASDSVVVDVGGNIGFYAIRQARRATNGRIVTFEPGPSTFSRLKRNVQANACTNITPINAALGETAGTVHFLESALSINCKVVAEATPETIDVPCDTLDSALPRTGITRIDILKIDTEGFEQPVLRGAEKTLPNVARMVIELHKDVRAEKVAVDAMAAAAGLFPVAQEGSLVYYERRAQSA